MKTTIIAISAALLLAGAITPFASAQGVPDWVKNNAGWWADGAISETEFISGIEHLIKQEILLVPATTVSAQTTQQAVPDWVKNNAGWWADGAISDEEFLNGIQHMIKVGIINVSLSENEPSQQEPENTDSKLMALQAQLDSCAEIKKAYERLNCEKDAKHGITAHKMKNNSEMFKVGPITYYWPGLGTDGNTFEITSSGQALLNLRILVENTDSTQKESLFCTGPAVCNYEITAGDKVYKYSQMDFTNGQVILKPGEPKLFNMMFGPNIGGGGTTFEYDSTKEYHFRINESFGSGSIPLNLG